MSLTFADGVEVVQVQAPRPVPVVALPGPAGPSGGAVTAWDPDTEYPEGVFTDFDGVLYRSLTESQDAQPDESPDEWERVGSGAGGAAGWADVLDGDDEVVAVEATVPVVLDDQRLYYRQNDDKNHSLGWGYSEHGIDGPVLNGFTAVGVAVGDANDAEDVLVAEFDADGVKVAPLATSDDAEMVTVDDQGRFASAPIPTGAAPHASTHAEGGSDPVTLTQDQVTGLAGALGAKADLIGGVVPSAQIPAIAVTEYLGAVASEAAMLALVGQAGDWCTRTDLSMNAVITGPDPTDVDDWTLLEYPTAPVQSVNGETGVVTLSAADVGAEPAGTTQTHIDDATSAHAASAVSVNPSGLVVVSGTTVQAAIAQLDAAAAAGGGDGKVYVHTSSTTPSGGDGNNGDVALLTRDGGDGSSVAAQFYGPKVAGAWPASGQVNSGGDRAFLALRSKSQVNADVIPGWRTEYDSSWCTGTCPSDLERVGTFGGSWYSNGTGNRVAIQRNRVAAGAPMAFFSGWLRLTTLPESGRFVWFGQYVNLAGGLYGFGARIDSSGNVLLRSEDAFGGATATLDSGLTIAANDSIVVERFQGRMSIYKQANASRELLGPENATATNRPLNARVDDPLDLYPGLFAGASYGYHTDSASVRASNVRMTG